MSKTLSYFLGVVTGVIITLATLFVFALIKSQGQEQDLSNDDGITMFEQPGKEIAAKRFEVIQVIPYGALAISEEIKYSISTFTGPVVFFPSEGQNTYYDNEVITVPKGKHARQIGTYQYDTELGYKTVPVVQIM